MGILAWLRRLAELPSARHVVHDYEWGEVREWTDRGCRNIQWSAMMQPWEDLEPVVDRFLGSAVDAVVAAYPDEPVPWLVLRFDPLTGMLSADPAPDPDWVNGGERVQQSLSSMFWEAEARRTYHQSPDGSYDPLYEHVWGMVRRSLHNGELGRRLAAARQRHPLEIAAFNSPSGCGDEPVRL